MVIAASNDGSGISDSEISPSGSRRVGFEITGIDLAAGVGDAEFATIRDALHRHSVVCLRKQRITVPQQVAFCSMFGTPEPHATQYRLPGFQEVLCVSNILNDDGKPIGITDAGRMWHTDGHFDKFPTMYSMLHSIEIPTDEHGEPLGSTWFLSTADAYDALSGEMKQRIDGLVGESTMAAAYRYYAARNLATNRAPLTEAQRSLRGIHPVARTHPVTGRKCIYVSEGQTELIQGLGEDESTQLIKTLQDHCVQEQFIYRHRWQVGDLVIWDNCSSQHYAIADYALPQRRLMHRVSVAGHETF